MLLHFVNELLSSDCEDLRCRCAASGWSCVVPALYHIVHSDYLSCSHLLDTDFNLLRPFRFGEKTGAFSPLPHRPVSIYLFIVFYLIVEELHDLNFSSENKVHMGWLSALSYHILVDGIILENEWLQEPLLILNVGLKLKMGHWLEEINFLIGLSNFKLLKHLLVFILLDCGEVAVSNALDSCFPFAFVIYERQLSKWSSWLDGWNSYQPLKFLHL